MILSVILLFAAALPARAEEHPDFATVWFDWTVESREAYLAGLRDGLIFSFVACGDRWLPAAEWPPQTAKLKTKRVREAAEVVLWSENIGELSRVISGLYSDERNRFIGFRPMAALARDRLRGFDISLRVLEERKAAR